ncbi:mitochondrial ribosomal protein L27 precursor, putative [Plasmodium reichenowi]|uniref:Mitochondrial ribosomal protein L27, putative n=1 Tax=Plasmodium reichenowi TaxID=5854 RepID=A0A151LU05_PLARE|nr:mitochondrial ribosomal protein L27 precursor, putative [Plasmodium reichenowi]KYO02653.1 mitochondrial ribosomal protein L27 precursor, putative [Plasmodium reichenowi]
MNAKLLCGNSLCNKILYKNVINNLRGCYNFARPFIISYLKLEYINNKKEESCCSSNIGIKKEYGNKMKSLELLKKRNIFHIYGTNFSTCMIKNMYNNKINIYNYDGYNHFVKIFKRYKMVKTSSYRRKARSSPNGQAQKAKIGIKRLSGEYVRTGQMLVKQRKIICFNYENKTRRRNFKYYPGENVKVAKNTSLIALTNGRVKFTFHVIQNVFLVNILPEELEELKEQDLYRYRTEHVKSFEENRSLIYLRMKNTILFPKYKQTQYIKPPLKPQFLTKYDIYDNPTLQKVPLLYHKRK